MTFLQSSVGRKVVMAITGELMVLFLIGHLLGNSLIFAGSDSINAYAEHLRRFGFLLWMLRLPLLICFVVHVFYGIQLTLENRKAKTQSSAVKKYLNADVAGTNMIWTGLALGMFVLYHLLQFTFRVTPDVVRRMDSAGRYDVFSMVTAAFRHPLIVVVYVAAMVTLMLHLGHGLQSFFQTMGWTRDTIRGYIIKTGWGIAVIFFVGYSAIPLSILFSLAG